MNALDGRTAIITGGAQGIGAALVRGFVAAGANVVVADLVEAAGLAAEMPAGRVLPVTVDVSREDDCREMVAAAERHFGAIDVLINNAAMFTSLAPRLFTEIPLDEWEATMAVNVRGPWLCSRAVWPAMIAAGQGSIIHMATNRVLSGVPQMLHYDASKGAVLAMTRAMAVEGGEHNIRVNAIAPGLTLSDNVRARSGIDTRNEVVVERRALKRSQLPEDVVGAAVFLASDASSFITGHTLVVDGGSIIR